MASIADRSLLAAFMPIGSALPSIVPTAANPALIPALIKTIGIASAVLFTDLVPTYPVRRIYIANTHATQDLALFLVPTGQAAGAEVVTTDGGLVVLARSIGSFLIAANCRILVVGSAAATTFQAVSSDV